MNSCPPRSFLCPLLLVTVLRNPVSRVVSEWFHYGQAQFIKKPPIEMPSAPEVFAAKGFSLKNGSATEAMQHVLLFLHQFAYRLMPAFGGIEGNQESPEFFQSRTSVLFKELRNLRDTHRYWDLMEAYVSHPATANLQVKQLLGYPIYSNVNVDEKDVQNLLQMHACFHSDPDDSCRQEQPLLLAGVLEQYNETIQYFTKQLKWNLTSLSDEAGHIRADEVAAKNTPEDEFLQKTPGKVNKKDIPQHIIAAIKRSNHLDQMLYDGVVKELKARAQRGLAQ